MFNNTDGSNLHKLSHRICVFLPDVTGSQTLDYFRASQRSNVAWRLHGRLREMFQETDHPMLESDIRRGTEQMR
jgi:hypothetical protein